MATDKPNVLLILTDDVGCAGRAAFDELPPRQAPAGFNPQGLVEAVLAAAAQRHGN